MNKILQKLNVIQKGLNAPKGQYNSFGKYKYRNCEDILEALKPLLIDSVVNLTDEVASVGDRFYIKATASLICTETGERVSSSAYAREEDSKKGMDGSQVSGSSSSYARKYALNGLFAIDDTKDSDSTNNGKTEQKTTQKPAQQTGKKIMFGSMKDTPISEIQRGSVDVLLTHSAWAKDKPNLQDYKNELDARYKELMGAENK